MPTKRDFAKDFPKDFPLLINQIPCAIYFGDGAGGYGISEAITPEGRSVTVYFQCYWDDRMDLVAGLVGVVDYQGGSILRIDPLIYPLADQDSIDKDGGVYPNRLFCTSVTSIAGTKGWRDDDGINTGQAGWAGYAFAILQAEFTSPAYLIKQLMSNGQISQAFNDISYQTYCISNIRVSGEVFAPPTGAFVYASGTFSGQSLLDTGAAQIRTRSEVSITRVRMPLIPMQVAGPLIGTVNSEQFLVAGQMYPKGSMLFNGFNPSPRTDPYNGGIIWDVEYSFLANSDASSGTSPLDWNYFLDPEGVWSKVTTKTGTDVFKYADHFPLYANAIS